MGLRSVAYAAYEALARRSDGSGSAVSGQTGATGATGPAGKPGTQITVGNGPPPSDATGNPGDLYLEAETGDLYRLQ